MGRMSPMAADHRLGAASAIPMCCPLCGHPLHAGGARTILTRDGGHVHITCADRHARRAWSRRQRWALLQAAVILSAVVLLRTPDGVLWGLVVGGATHLL